MATIKELETALGDTTEAVAAKLLELHCKGFRKSPRYCPIAIYINERAKLWPGADFQPGGIFFHDAQIMDYHFKQPVTDFMKRFDAGEFPELALAEIRL